jgi:hydroxyacylglutathione hydrolase
MATPDPSMSSNAGSKPGIAAFALGPFETNCYVVTPSGTGKDCWIVDASFEPEDLIEHVRSAGLIPKALILTHAHVDHIAGVGEVLRAFPGLPIHIHADEEAWLNDPMLNLSAMMGTPVTSPMASRLLREGDELTLGGDTWRILHTPGHSPGGITLYHEPSRSAIVGDALFSGSIGRTDFPGSDHETLVRSIKQKLYTLPDQTSIYPGHGPPSTVGREKRSNPFVRP